MTGHGVKPTSDPCSNKSFKLVKRLRDMRRYIILLLTAALIAGCSEAPVQTKVVRFSNWGGASDNQDFEKLVNGFFQQFEKENPGVDVRVEGIPGEYVQKMLLNHIAKTMPDVMTVDASSAAIFVDNGVLEDLTPYVEKDPEVKLSDYWPNALGIGRRGKALYTLPGDFTPMVVYYNKRIFDKAGVPYPKPGWTFDDFLRTSQALTKDGKYGFAFANWMPGWVMWLWNNGGEVLSPDGKKAGGYLDSPQNVKTVGFLADLINKYKVSPSLSQTAALGVDLFANGQAAMTVSGHWSIVGYKNSTKQGNDFDWKELGVVEMPSNTGKSETVMYEAGFGIPAQSKHKDLAWKLVKMWTGYRLQKVYNSSGIAICGRKDVASEHAVDPIEKEFLRIVPTARPPAGSWVEGYATVEDIGQKMMDRVLDGDDPAEALRWAAQRIDKEFAKR
jgi:multiple sugar transport system substrate-binding protein